MLRFRRSRETHFNMFLHLFLLFVTSAVPVDKPEDSFADRCHGCKPSEPQFSELVDDWVLSKRMTTKLTPKKDGASSNFDPKKKFDQWLVDIVTIKGSDFVASSSDQRTIRQFETTVKGNLVQRLQTQSGDNTAVRTRFKRGLQNGNATGVRRDPGKGVGGKLTNVSSSLSHRKDNVIPKFERNTERRNIGLEETHSGSDNISMDNDTFRENSLNPWLFIHGLGNEPKLRFSRLWLMKSEIERYTAQTDKSIRLISAPPDILSVNNTVLDENGNILAIAQVQKELPTLQLNDYDLSDHDPTASSHCYFLSHFQNVWIKLVATCVSSWSNELVKNQCIPNYESQDDDRIIDVLSLPVQDEKGVVYRNLFCAECNYAKNVKAWNVQIVCDKVSSFVYFSGDVFVTLMPSLGLASHCTQTIFPPIPELVHVCHSIKKKRSAYRAISPFRPTSSDLTNAPISFSVLMNFGFDGKTQILFSTTRQELQYVDNEKCPQNNQIWDEKYQQCRTILCPSGYTLRNNKCTPGSSSGNNVDTNRIIPDIKTLTNLSDAFRITLTVSDSYKNLLPLLSPNIEDLLVPSLATVLNISTERIQNFTISVSNSSGNGSKLNVDPVTTKPFIVPEVPSEEVFNNLRQAAPRNQLGQNTHEIVPSEKPNLTVYDKTMITTTVPTEGDKAAKWIKGGRKVNISRSTAKPNVRKNGRKTSTPKPPSESLLGKKITLQLTFLLLPARASQLREGTISSVRERMKSLFKQNKFTLTVNGTAISVVSIEDKGQHLVTGAFCERGKLHMYYADQLKLIDAVGLYGNNSQTHILVEPTNTLYGPGKYDLTVLVSGNVARSANLTDFAGYAFVCDMPKLSREKCVRFEYNQSEYTLLPNKSIILGDKLYNMSEYEYVYETTGLIMVHICVPDAAFHHPLSWGHSYVLVSACSPDYNQFILAEAYMTAILGRISIVALSIVFLTYTLFPKLRNLPGVNTMNLTLALLIAESIFIIGEVPDIEPWACSMVAVLLHYFFLASFFWMNVMSYDVYKTFANTACSLPHIREKSKYLCKYVLYSWGSPAIIVCCCVILDFTNIIPRTNIGYGKSFGNHGNKEANASINESSHVTNTTSGNSGVSLGCWINDPIPALVAFGAPIVIILFANACMFIRTILCIQKTAKFTSDNTRRSSVSKRPGRHDVMLYVRMSTVMGFTWLFGLASSFVSVFVPHKSPTNVVCLTEHIIALLFVIFNCSQGLFIFFAFVTKRRVFYLYKGLYVRIRGKMTISKSHSRSRHASASTSSTTSATSTSTISTIG